MLCKIKDHKFVSFMVVLQTLNCKMAFVNAVKFKVQKMVSYEIGDARKKRLLML